MVDCLVTAFCMRREVFLASWAARVDTQSAGSTSVGKDKLDWRSAVLTPAGTLCRSESRRWRTTLCRAWEVCRMASLLATAADVCSSLAWSRDAVDRTGSAGGAGAWCSAAHAAKAACDVRMESVAVTISWCARTISSCVPPRNQSW